MAHFAQLDKNNIVINVLVVPDKEEHRGEEFLSKDLGLGGRWIQTSYNGNIRKNYAGIGYLYDEKLDAFIPPKPYPSWKLDKNTCTWKAPKMQFSSLQVWNESKQRWE
jgi:hypothetical protein